MATAMIAIPRFILLVDSGQMTGIKRVVPRWTQDGSPIGACEEATPAAASSNVLSPPIWMHGSWTTQGADTAHSTYPAELEVDKNNIRVIGPRAGVDFAGFATRAGVSMTDKQVSTTHYRVSITVDGSTESNDFVREGLSYQRPSRRELPPRGGCGRPRSRASERDRRKVGLTTDGYTLSLPTPSASFGQPSAECRTDRRWYSFGIRSGRDRGPRYGTVDQSFRKEKACRVRRTPPGGSARRRA